MEHKFNLTLIKFTSFLLFSNFVLGSAYAAKALDDDALADQTDHLARLTPIVISAVQEDVQLSQDNQYASHDRIAKDRAAKAQKANLDAGVLSVSQVQKKTIDLTPVSDTSKDYSSQKIRYYIVGRSAQNNNVRIETADHVTIYVNPKDTSVPVAR